MTPRSLFLSILLFAQLTVSFTAGLLEGELLVRGAVCLSFLLPLVFLFRAPVGTPPLGFLPRERAGVLWLCLLPLFILLTAGTSIGWGELCRLLGVEITGAEPMDRLWAALLFDAALPAVCEELFCRGALFSVLRPLGRRAAVLGSAFLFAMMHTSVAQFPYALLAGILLGVLYEATGSLLLTMLFHFANNLTSLLLLFGAPPLWVFLALLVMASIGLAVFFRVTVRHGGPFLPEREREPWRFLRELFLSPVGAYVAVMLLFTVL